MTTAEEKAAADLAVLCSISAEACTRASVMTGGGVDMNAPSAEGENMITDLFANLSKDPEAAIMKFIGDLSEATKTGAALATLVGLTFFM